MTWMLLVALLIEAFGPALAEWLKKLLEGRAGEMDDAGDLPHDDPDRFGAQLDYLFETDGLRPWQKLAVLLVRRRLDRLMTERGGDE